MIHTDENTCLFSKLMDKNGLRVFTIDQENGVHTRSATYDNVQRFLPVNYLFIISTLINMWGT